MTTTPTSDEVRADRVRQGVPPTIPADGLREFVDIIRRATDKRRAS